MSTSMWGTVGANKNATVANGIIWGTFPLRAQCGREPPGRGLCGPVACRPPRTCTNLDVVGDHSSNFPSENMRYISTMALLALCRKSLRGKRIRIPEDGSDIPKLGQVSRDSPKPETITS